MADTYNTIVITDKNGTKFTSGVFRIPDNSSDISNLNAEIEELQTQIDNIPSIDSTVTEDSSNLITSGAVYEAIQSSESSLTVEVGTTTTGDAGTSASVTNSGTEKAAIFNFTIPKGDTGAAGPQGEQGEDGKGISSITKTSTSGLIDTYTITYTDSTTTNFTITNGEDGNGIISFADGTITTSGDYTITPVTVTTDNGDMSFNVYAKNGDGASMTIDKALSTTSGNPVANSVITTALNNTVDLTSEQTLSSKTFTGETQFEDVTVTDRLIIESAGALETNTIGASTASAIKFTSDVDINDGSSLTVDTIHTHSDGLTLVDSNLSIGGTLTTSDSITDKGGSIVVKDGAEADNITINYNNITRSISDDSVVTYTYTLPEISGTIALTSQIPDLSALGNDIIPSTDSTYNLGSTTYKWLHLYVDNISSTTGGNLYIESSLIPSTSDTYDLGSVDSVWRALYTNQVTTAATETLQICTSYANIKFDDTNGTFGIELSYTDGKGELSFPTHVASNDTIELDVKFPYATDPIPFVFGSDNIYYGSVDSNGYLDSTDVPVVLREQLVHLTNVNIEGDSSYECYIRYLDSSTKTYATLIDESGSALDEFVLHRMFERGYDSILTGIKTIASNNADSYKNIIVYSDDSLLLAFDLEYLTSNSGLTVETVTTI